MSDTMATAPVKAGPVRISRTKMVDLINQTNGRICTIVFRKLDGTVRTVNGNKKNNATTKLGYILINDLAKKEIVSFDPKNLMAFRFKGVDYVTK